MYPNCILQYYLNCRDCKPGDDKKNNNNMTDELKKFFDEFGVQTNAEISGQECNNTYYEKYPNFVL